MKPFTTFAVFIFALIALAHVARLITGFDVMVAGTVIPQWVSFPGAFIAAGLAWTLWQESRR